MYGWPLKIANARKLKNSSHFIIFLHNRVRVGHCVYETPTCANGAREPKWNKTFNCYLLAGVKRVDIEIYDECTFQVSQFDSSVQSSVFCRIIVSFISFEGENSPEFTSELFNCV